MLNNIGDYVMFPSSSFHHGYFSIKLNGIYYTAQIFAKPSELTSRASTSRKSLFMTSEIKGTMTCQQVTDFSNDVIQHWNTTYKNKKYNPAKGFDGEQLNSDYHCHIRRKDFQSLNVLEEFVKYVESILYTIQIDSIWIMAKSKQNKGFQKWHQDKVGMNVTTTIVMNIGVQK